MEKVWKLAYVNKESKEKGPSGNKALMKDVSDESIINNMWGQQKRFNNLEDVLNESLFMWLSVASSPCGHVNKSLEKLNPMWKLSAMSRMVRQKKSHWDAFVAPFFWCQCLSIVSFFSISSYTFWWTVEARKKLMKLLQEMFQFIILSKWQRNLDGMSFVKLFFSRHCPCC